MSNSLQELKETEELDIQLRVFNENKEEDLIELSHRLDDIRAEMEYPFVLPLWEYTDSAELAVRDECISWVWLSFIGWSPLMALFIREGFEELEHIIQLHLWPGILGTVGQKSI